MDVFEINKMKIAKKVIKENPLFTELIGGMTQGEAKKILESESQKKTKRQEVHYES